MTPHSWRTHHHGLASSSYSCTRCGAQTNNALLADIHNECPAMTEANEDLRKARLYLQLDPDEMANVRAEHEKYERRKLAMQRGDTGSPVEPVSFSPIYCTGCDITLTRANHGSGQQCQRCFDEDQSLKRYESARDAYLKTRANRWRVLAIGWEKILVWSMIALSLVVSAALVWKEIFG